MTSNIELDEIKNKVISILGKSNEKSDEVIQIINKLYYDDESNQDMEKKKSHFAVKGKISVDDYEDFLLELLDISKSVQFVAELLDSRDEFVAEDIAPIIRLFDHNIAICYNHFARLGEVLYNSPFKLVSSRDQWYERTFTRLYSESDIKK